MYSLRDVISELREKQRTATRIKERVEAISRSADFFMSDWSGLRPISMVSIEEAVALSCGINKKYGWVLKTLDSNVAGLPIDVAAALNAARERLRFVTLKFARDKSTDISLSDLAGVLLAHGEKLPSDYPGPRPNEDSGDSRLKHLGTIQSAVESAEASSLSSKVASKRDESVHSAVGSEPMGEQAFPMTKKALIAKYKARWVTIERDLQDASENSLSRARAGKRGWIEREVVEWARSKGKLQLDRPTSPASAMPTFDTLPAVTRRKGR